MRRRGVVLQLPGGLPAPMTSGQQLDGPCGDDAKHGFTASDAGAGPSSLEIDVERLARASASATLEALALRCIPTTEEEALATALRRRAP